MSPQQSWYPGELMQQRDVKEIRMHEGRVSKKRKGGERKWECSMPKHPTHHLCVIPRGGLDIG